VKGKVTEHIDLRAKQSFRTENDAGTLGTYYIEAALVTHLTTWLDLSPAYRQQVTKDKGQWLDENRPYVDATIKWKLLNLAFSDRNRFEYRFRQARDDTFRYRNKLSSVFPKKWTPLELQPYVAGEAFFDEGVKATDRNRMRFTFGAKTDPETRLRALGLKPKEGLRMTTDFYFHYQSTDRDGDTVDEYIAGVNFGVSL